MIFLKNCFLVYVILVQFFFFAFWGVQNEMCEFSLQLIWSLDDTASVSVVHNYGNNYHDYNYHFVIAGLFSLAIAKVL